MGIKKINFVAVSDLSGKQIMIGQMNTLMDSSSTFEFDAWITVEYVAISSTQLYSDIGYKHVMHYLVNIHSTRVTICDKF
jgi:hypothetical protein